jgi:hypothetical protein
MGIELGIGESLLVKAIAESTGRATTKIKDDLRKEGDLGKVAMVSDYCDVFESLSLIKYRCREIPSQQCSSPKH